MAKRVCGFYPGECPEKRLPQFTDKTRKPLPGQREIQILTCITVAGEMRIVTSMALATATRSGCVSTEGGVLQAGAGYEPCPLSKPRGTIGGRVGTWAYGDSLSEFSPMFCQNLGGQLPPTPAPWFELGFKMIKIFFRWVWITSAFEILKRILLKNSCKKIM